MFNPWHYVPLLERKPGALRNGAAFQDWDLPQSLQKVKRSLMTRLGGDRQCVRVLLAIAHHGLEAVTVACDLALEDKVISADYILNLLGRLTPTLFLLLYRLLFDNLSSIPHIIISFGLQNRL